MTDLLIQLKGTAGKNVLLEHRLTSQTYTHSSTFLLSPMSVARPTFMLFSRPICNLTLHLPPSSVKSNRLLENITEKRYFGDTVGVVCRLQKAK